MSTEYRVEFTIQRRLDGDDDFTDVGFGSSGAWDSVAAANFSASTAIECREWETTGDMPDPSHVDVPGGAA